MKRRKPRKKIETAKKKLFELAEFLEVQLSVNRNERNCFKRKALRRSSFT